MTQRDSLIHPSGTYETTCRECGAAVRISNAAAYFCLGPPDLCDRHYAEWFRANRKDPK